MDVAKGVTWGSGQTVCRCCLSEGCYKDISSEYFWMGKREVYSEMLSDTFDVNIGFPLNGGSNSTSRLICELCITRLRDASEFKRQVLDCEKVFTQHLEGGSSQTCTVDIEEDKHVKMEVVKTEKLDSDHDHDDGDEEYEPDMASDDDDLDDEPLTKFATKVPKKESEESLLDLLEDTKPAKRKVAAKAKASPAKKVKVTKKDLDKPSTSSKAVAKVDKKKKENMRRLDMANDGAKRNAIMILRYSSANPFKTNVRSQVRCCFCELTFQSAEEFSGHMAAVHEAVLKSVVAENSFSYNGLPRVDVSDLRCKSCPKAFANLDSLARHLAEEHEIEMDFSRNYGLVPISLKTPNVCVVCDCKFNCLYTLWRHSGTHYAKNVCELCGSCFETKAGLSSHISLAHDLVRKCRMCKQIFESKEALKIHSKTNEACLPVGCSVAGCTKRFASWETKEKHMVQEHSMQRKTFPCPECNEVFLKQKSYYRHFKSSHTNDIKCQYCNRGFSCKRDLEEHLPRHTGVKPHQCTVCGKMFTTAKGVREHTSMHSNEEPERVRYSCPSCERIFVVRKKLLTHIRKTHLDVYQQIVDELDATENDNSNKQSAI